MYIYIYICIDRAWAGVSGLNVSEGNYGACACYCEATYEGWVVSHELFFFGSTTLIAGSHGSVSFVLTRLGWRAHFLMTCVGRRPEGGQTSWPS